MKYALIAASLLATPAVAQQPFCMSQDQLTTLLHDRHSEVPVGSGTQGVDALWVVFASEKGSWTIVVMRPDGSACAVAVGQDWQAIEQGDPV